MRKTPKQERANATIGTILEAAAQVLQREGDDKFNTNRVAERAGVSIGTVYQYFHNKEAIVAALAERERKAVVAAISQALRRAAPKDVDDVLRQIIRTLIGAFSRRRHLRKFMILNLLRGAQFKAAQRSTDAIAELLVTLVAARPKPGFRSIDATGAYVLTRAILGAIRAAVLEESPILDTPGFEDELVRLALNFLRE